MSDMRLETMRAELPVGFRRYNVFMPDVTQMLDAIQDGDQQAADLLLPLIYDELRQLAASKMARESAGHTLQPTALVHEAYMRLVKADGNGDMPQWNSRGHFFMAAAEAMRRILIERARQKKTIKHGGEHRRVDLDAVDLESGPDAIDQLLELNEALKQFEQAHPVEAKLVVLRYFAGLTLVDAAEAMDISRATASRYWAFAKAWFHEVME